MVKGSIAKEIIAKEILNHFEGSFLNDKEIRIPMDENGEIVEIKVTLTAAKVSIGESRPVPIPSDEITKEELNRIKELSNLIK